MAMVMVTLFILQMPLVHPGFSQVSNIRSFAYGVYVRPPYLSAINDVIRFHDWKDVIYLYDSDDGKDNSILMKQTALGGTM